MSADLILFVLLILFVFSVLYVFGHQETNVKNTQPSGSANQPSRPGETDGNNTYQRNETEEQPKCSKETARVTDETLTRRRRVADTSGDSISNERNKFTGSAFTSSEEYSKADSDEEVDDLADEKNIFREFVNEYVLNEYMEQNGVLRGLLKYIKENIDEWKTRKLDIAIIGNSGTGKSSLINAVRGLKPIDDKAAPVGVTETTTEKRKYEFPNNENIMLWDLPGVGSPQLRREDYLEKMNIRGLDVFIIVSASRFTENEIWLAKEILKRKNFIFFVRTKVDIDLMNDKRDHPETFNADSCLKVIRMEILKYLAKAKIPVPKAGIFLISSVERDSYDFQDMFEKLRDLLVSKGVSVQKLLQEHVKQVVIKKSDARKNGFFLEKIASIIWPCISLNILLEYVSKKLFKKMYRRCKEEFCLDDRTLQEVSEEKHIPVKLLKTRYLSVFKTIEDDSYNPLSEYLKLYRHQEKVLPGYYVFQNNLNTVCDLMANAEVKLIELRLSRLVEDLTPL